MINTVRNVKAKGLGKVRRFTLKQVAKIFPALLIGCLVFVLAHIGFAQGTTMPQRSPLKIDPREGKLNLTIAFTAGADRMGAPIMDELYYSSAVWDMNYSVIQGQIQTFYQTSTNYDSRGGWSSSLDTPTLTTDTQLYDNEGYSSDTCDGETGCGQGQTALYYINKKIVSIPGIGTHDLYKDEDPHLFTPQTPNRENFGIFYAVDGSRIKYDADTGTLYLPNGSRYLFSGGQTTTYIDRQGNQRTYNQTGRFWTDTLGRVYRTCLQLSAKSDLLQ